LEVSVEKDVRCKCHSVDLGAAMYDFTESCLPSMDGASRADRAIRKLAQITPAKSASQLE
jgi:hypothetical protein